VAKRRNAEQRYQDGINQQKRKLDEFISHETEWAEHLLLWYRLKKKDMPDDEYRGCAYFTNKEYLTKQGSLNLLYQTHLSCEKELPEVTKENAIDLVRYKYKTYALVLSKGGY
jgi:hypothetical protein